MGVARAVAVKLSVPGPLGVRSLSVGVAVAEGIVFVTPRLQPASVRMKSEQNSAKSLPESQMFLRLCIDLRSFLSNEEWVRGTWLSGNFAPLTLLSCYVFSKKRMN